MPTPPTNRLADETSAYLLQHAHNPVDWFPWGAEALARARELDRPIFLSVGYSACHWCHVMERESFEEEGIAALLNESFVSIKVDREERPDLDHVYMAAVQVMTGAGGWPMSVFLLPDGRPFFGGTYWPPESRWGRPGFRQVLERIVEAWGSEREKLEGGASDLVGAVDRLGVTQSEPVSLDRSILENAATRLMRAADRSYGGFGQAPKFPHPMDLRFLLRWWRHTGRDDVLEVVQTTLDRMAAGGIYDHLGGGFHRYSTDVRWLVPHFEKMLYDNAQLVTVYLEAYQATGEEDYARVARETLDYVLREMTRPGGGFYSTQDADSEGEEGRFFVWSDDEVREHLDAADAGAFCYCYDVTPEGNWEGKSILHRVKTHAEAARAIDIDTGELDTILARGRERLLAVRSRRVAPARDDKVIVAWNALMIAAMAQAARVLDEPRYATAAGEAIAFVLDQLRDADRRLGHSWQDGQFRGPAFLDDYAGLIDALVEAYQATFEPELLDEAIELAEQIDERFGADDGGFFYTPSDHEQLFTRSRDTQDSATPSGNSMAAWALLRLGRITGRSELAERGVKLLERLSSQLAEFPMASGHALLALDDLLGPSTEIVVVDGDDPQASIEMFRVMARSFVPRSVVLRRPAGWTDEMLPGAVAPLLGGRTAVDGSATAWVCSRGTCRPPITDSETLLEAISQAHNG